MPDQAPIPGSRASIEARSASPFHQTTVSNDGTPQPALVSQTQQPDHRPPMTPERHRLAQMTAGQLAEMEMADDIRATQSVVHKRQSDGSVTIEPRKPGSEQQQDQQQVTQDAATDKIKVGQYEISESELGELLQRTGQQDLNAATAPTRPEDYQARLPEGFQLPQGIAFSIDDASPLLADARAFAHEHKLSQAAFEKMVAMHASAVGADAAQLNAARSAEISKLGATANQRVTSVNTWLRGTLGDDLAGAMQSVMATAKIVQGWEKIIDRFSSQGAAKFSQAHREPGGRSAMTEEQWSKMGASERLDYARQFPQPTGR